MKTCISTYSFARLIGSGAMDHFDVLDKIHEMGVPAAELVLDDNTSSSPLEFACRLADHARKLGLDVPIYTTGANFCCPDVEAEIRRVERHIDIAAEAGIPLLRHDITPGFYEGYTGLRTFEAILPVLAAKQRVKDPNDWMSTDADIACPDPNCGARFHITRTKKRRQRHGECTVVPLHGEE